MNRIPSLDLARGFTVFFIPAIHVLLLYSTTEVATSLPGKFLVFIAEGPGAQLFMTLMGISFTRSRRQGGKEVLRRSLLLLLLAYTLNALKFIVPYLWDGSLPPSLLRELGLAPREIPYPLLFTGDILHFAALCLPLLSFLYRQPDRPWIISTAIALTILFSSLFWDMQAPHPLTHYLMRLIGGHPPDCYFPLFPWLLYPLSGLFIGHCLQQYEVNKVFKGVGFIGAFLCIQGLLTMEHPSLPFPSFYRTGPAASLYHLGLVGVWLYLMQVVYRFFRGNPILTFLVAVSRRITTFYFFQWVLIYWCLPLAGYHSQPLLPSLLWMIAITALTCLISFTLLNKKQ